MSSWWEYDICAFGDPDKLKELEQTVHDLTYRNVELNEFQLFHEIIDVERYLGFVVIQASRNYGASDPVEGLCNRFPRLVFLGTYSSERTIDRYWSFEGRAGELTVEQHRPDPDFDESTAFALASAEEIKADIAKLEARIERQQREVADLKSYLARRQQATPQAA